MSFIVVSDLKRLKVVHIHDGRIDMFAKKTREHLTIPLTEEALRILKKYIGNKKDDELVFNMQSPQKLNDAVKDAAKAAGIDRTINEVYYIGTERKEGSTLRHTNQVGKSQLVYSKTTWFHVKSIHFRVISRYLIPFIWQQ